ncbi:MAG TPA: alpha/beta hydrolase [Myxococcota bacterium]
MRRVALAVLVVVALVAAGWWSGREPRLDALAAARSELALALEPRRVDVGEVTLFVVLAGPPEGPPIVLLHGFPEFWYAWKGVIAPLAAAGHRVIVPDQRGYGDSEKPRGVDAYRVELLADDVAGLIDALAYERADVAAHDWGGGVAWMLALRHPERVRRLAVLDTPHPDAARVVESREERISWYRTAFQIPWLPEWAARLGHWRLVCGMLRDTARPGAFPEEKLALYRSAWDRDGAFGAMVNWYRAAFRAPPPAEPPGARRVSAPTLLLLAPDDAFIPSDLTRASLQFLDDGRLVELERGTHWVLQEEPEAVAAELVRFFGAP